MPLIAREHHLNSGSTEYFARVLRDLPEIQAQLAAPPAGTRLIEGHFNGKPLALLLAEPAGAGWQVKTIAVHPASRGRGVGSTLLAQAGALLPGLGWPDCLEGVARRAGL
ncbi:GNAT family N-acetyltransferase [Alcanivorax quisquiliarum]|uniref:GNAT family N-acetyltransferase n=1 Tax=Alcanivorax quisquiliarum TaxID=2933565 RepID=A0ABT0E5P2_9GAMM|nr:GNAT family N-acetyltransferase [Alcanivorax quisquiliarum]MCK0537142.1 GNAT family N-acetyltransferase [Alcanivorax quisquiliarum]